MLGRNAYRKYGKRALDVILALLLLAVLWPLIAVAAVAVRAKLGAPVVFSQVRIGKYEKPFVMKKFRSMNDLRGDDGRLLPDSERITRLGKFLRETSIDELLELFNILKGEMSFVGPRPLPAEYLPYYTDRERKRHQVSPGLTGEAQIHGRNGIDWDRQFELDLKYVDTVSFAVDCRIILATVIKVLRREGTQPRAAGARLDELRSAGGSCGG